MRAKANILAVLSLVAVAVPMLAIGASLPSPSISPATAMREIRDEVDPNDAQSCYSFGRLDITFSSAQNGPPKVGMVVTDPRGRHIGFDPIKSKAWQELPEAEAFIDCDAPDGEGACRGVIQVCGPVSGTYKLEVFAQQNVEYSLSVSARSEEIRDKQGLQSSNSNAALKDVPIRQGSKDVLLLNYSRDFNYRVAFESPQAAPVASSK